MGLAECDASSRFHLEITHCVAPENFGDDRGRGIARPIAVSPEHPLGLPHAAAARRSEVWRCVFRPKNELCDVFERVSDGCVGLPTDMSDGFDCTRTRYR
jgi:hypothetical protein